MVELVPPPHPAAGRLARAARTRDRLLDAARVAFTASGWSRARVEDVCREAGVGHGTFYAYYANKAAVLAALLRRHGAELDRLLAAGCEQGDAPYPQIHAVIAGYVGITCRDADLRAVWIEAASTEPELARLVAEVRAGLVGRLRHALTAAADAGLARPGLDIETAAVALAAMVEQTVAVGLSDGGLDDRLVDGLADLWTAAVYR